ncbi:hypothetical protein D4A39_09440 [Alcanivorax profundi]|uniref:Uncharacterized protein n=2 Tax=Alcanivorax profundi TaxID=2338368 RepID=A0A418Y060_9GAMM|nr:hypothetical protein D4A39_09440 [Alcanivorax profundi]
MERFLKNVRPLKSTTGEKPGKGSYQCNNCQQVVHLDDQTDRLPPCPRCGETEFWP